MTSQWQDKQTLINCLHVRGRGLDPTLARLRLAALLSGAHLSPAGLAPSAILCVRRLRGPAPGSLSSRAVGGIVSPEWERAVATALGNLARRAARPAHGPVPASAEAVLFADHAELLACLASDYGDGSAAARWWWPSLFRGACVTPVRAMLDAPACVPAALEHLARRGKAVAFARSLGASEAHALLLSIVRVFALPYLQAALDAAFNAARRAGSEASEEMARHALQESRDAFLRREHNAAPAFEDSPAWHAFVPEGAGLTPQQQTLLGVGLMLTRAPTFVRTQTFARTTQRWLLNAVASFDSARAPAATRPLSGGARATHDASPPLAGRTSAHHRTTDAPRAGTPEESSVVALYDEPTTGTTSFGVEAKAGIEHSHPADIESSNQHQVSPVKTPGDARVLTEADYSAMLHRRESEVESHLPGFTDDARVERIATTRWTEESASCFESADTLPVHTSYVETKLGGIFYLINLALFLELYGDFTSPGAPGIPLGFWDFLALAGADLAGDSFHADPLRMLLAQLSGRGETEAPGAGFVPPDEWRVPAAWLQPFAAHVKLTWTAKAGRLRVRHPEGFLLLDLPLKRADARARLARETEAYKSHLSFELRHGRAPEQSNEAGDAGALKRWVARLMSYARARLRLALGLASADDISGVLCEHPARVLVSATHVDVFFSLAALPIEVRLSGIDRDPGWVPAAGRFITFHYE